MTFDKREANKILLVVTALTLLALGPAIMQSSFAAPDPNAKARAIQGGDSLDTSPGNEGIAGTPIDCVGGIETSANADSMKCYLVPEGVSTPNYQTGAVAVQESSVSTTCPTGAGFTSGMECFSTTFDGGYFTGSEDDPTHYRFVIEFYKNGQIVDIAGSNNFAVHSFLVIPESAIGAIALVGSSFAALAGYVFLRSRKTAITV
jgi:hypothetical protein